MAKLIIRIFLVIVSYVAIFWFALKMDAGAQLGLARLMAFFFTISWFRVRDLGNRAKTIKISFGSGLFFTYYFFSCLAVIAGPMGMFSTNVFVAIAAPFYFLAAIASWSVAGIGFHRLQRWNTLKAFTIVCSFIAILLRLHGHFGYN